MRPRLAMRALRSADATCPGRPRPRGGTRGGLFTLWSLSLSTLILLLIVGYYPFFNRALRICAFSFERARQLALAEAGFEDGLWELNWSRVGGTTFSAPFSRWRLAQELKGQVVDTAAEQYVDWDGDGLISPTDATNQQWVSFFATQVGWIPCPGAAECFERSVAGFMAGDGSGDVLGDYVVQVRGLGVVVGGGAVLTRSEGLSRPQVQIVSTGLVPGSNGQTLVDAIVERTHPTFRYGAFGDDGLHIDANATIDSYLGERRYDPISNRKDHGDIGTNGSRDDPAGELTVASSLSEVDGTAYVTAATGVSFPSPWPDPPTEIVTQLPHSLPPVLLPDPSAYPSVYGDVVVSTTEDCYEPRRYQSLQVADGGEVVMHANCRLFIDHQGSAVPSERALATSGSGAISRHTDAGSTQFTVFVKDGGCDLAGRGLVNTTSFQQPRGFQLYITGSDASARLAQTQPFYGAVYVEDPDGNDSSAGRLELAIGEAGDGSYANATYHGSFVAGGELLVTDMGQPSFTVAIHYDESLVDLPLDGRGNAAQAEPRYRIRTWQSR